MIRLRGLVGVTGTAVIALSALGVGASAASADDQARADAAIAEFNARVTNAGWTSSGPAEGDETDDEVFAECGVEAAFFDVLSGRSVPGVTASAESDEFTLTQGGGPPTTELFDVEASEQEFVAAVVVTVDADHVDDIASFVDAVGSDEFASCYAQLGFGGAAPEETTPIDDAFEFDVDGIADLGVGAGSGGLDMHVSGDVFGEQLALQASLLFAHVDRTLIGVVWGYQGDGKPTSGLDPVVELASLAEPFSG